MHPPHMFTLRHFILSVAISLSRGGYVVCSNIPIILPETPVFLRSIPTLVRAWAYVVTVGSHPLDALKNEVL